MRFNVIEKLFLLLMMLIIYDKCTNLKFINHHIKIIN